MRPWQIRTLLALSLAIVLGAMGWVSLTVLRLDQEQAELRRQAVVEENVRLALWRMDSALAPLVAGENARPYFSYTPFYPAERAYTYMFNELRVGDVLIPSPLLVRGSPYILLHFQFAPDGKLSSPQVPTGNMLDLAESAYTTPEEIQVSSDRLAELQAGLSRNALISALGREEPELLATAGSPPVAQAPRTRWAKAGQDILSAVEQQQRRTWQQGLQTQQRASNVRLFAPSRVVKEGTMKPLWVGERLVLARQVSVNGEDYVQGCWLDWPAIKEWLIGDVKDLLPAANLEPVSEEFDEGEARMLAGLPVRLVPGPFPFAVGDVSSPVRLSLVIAWGCILLAAGAVSVMVLGTMSLSEKRGAFVSAVTHELRTPLTTFRLYAEMLAEKMVPDEKKREHYLNTLRLEAERLSHLVENVLTYAQLERGKAGEDAEVLTLQELFERVKGQLLERATRAGMVATINSANGALPLKVRADPSAVERILLNLVDNACKYAASAPERRICLEVDRRDDVAVLRVRDYGPGISKREERRLFKPFRKSAREAANSAPGVGLGLALSQRLARRMGGRLGLNRRVKEGACFELILPLV